MLSPCCQNAGIEFALKGEYVETTVKVGWFVTSDRLFWSPLCFGDSVHVPVLIIDLI